MTPSDADLLGYAHAARRDNPELGVLKLLSSLRVQRPEWSVSEKRFRKVLNPPGLVAATGLDPTIDIASIAPSVTVKLFANGKGKGLIATKRIERGQVIWTEEPWIATADSGLRSALQSGEMCTRCLSLFKQPNPPLSTACSSCNAHFCNRLCHSRAAQSASHLPLLCIGRYPPVAPLLARASASRHLDAVIRILALWRTERETDPAHAAIIDKRVWTGMARISQLDKEQERAEWPYVGEQRLQELQSDHALVVRTLNPPASDPHYNSFKKICRRPLNHEEERWFTFDSFLQLLGLAGLNQESSGGLYALHAHLNHSCAPNVQVRNLPKSYVQPTPPCDLPPPNGPGVRGTNRLTIIARQTIDKGEELTVPYVDFSAPREERRQALREQYGFWCTCSKCSES